MDKRDIYYKNKIEKELKNQRVKQHKRRVKSLLARVSIFALLLVISTYAWFTSQKDITLSNIRGTVEVVENMEISLDAKNWYQQIDLTEAEVLFGAAQQSRDEVLGEKESDTKSTALTILPEQLLPVSGVGEITSNKFLPMYVGEATSTSLSEIEQCLEEKTEGGKDVVVDNGYIAFDMYIKNTSRDNEDDILQLNVNSVAQVLTSTVHKTITDVTGNRVERDYTGNADSGLQNTVRVALAMYNGGITSTATQLEILESTKDATIKDLAIWEPNAYDHVESIVANNNRLINGTEANKIPFTANQTVDTYALTEDTIGETIDNVYNIASTGLGLQGTFKTDNVKNADGEVVDYRIYTETAKPLNIKNTVGDDFVIASNTVTRFRVYVWLEGQDIDCINIASLGGGIELDLGLTKDDEIGDGAGSRLLASVDYDLTEVTNGEVTATITANRAIELPTGWTYGEVGSYALASTEWVKLATENEASNNIISKVFTENTEEYVTIEDGSGVSTVVRVKIDEFENEDEEDLVTGVLSELIENDKAENYGLYTDYPVDIDGDVTNNDWKIFYSDDTNVFLITEEHATHAKIGNDKLTAAGLTTSEKNTVAWENPASLNYTISNSKYMISRAGDFLTTNENYQPVGSLLTTSNWTNFVNSSYANDAIGSPTIEMWIESWNTKYPEDKLYCNNGNENGYYIGTETNPTSRFIMPNEISVLEGYDDSLYYLKCEDICGNYWLAAPAGSNSYQLLCVNESGGIGGIGYRADVSNEGAGNSLRPVVALKPGIEATKVGDVWKLED